MSGVEGLWLFLAAGVLLNLTPGPDMLYVAARSASQGHRAGVVSALGIASGGLVHTAAAAFGLSALVLYSAVGFELVRWAGAAYLVYLGIRSLRGAGRGRGPETPEREPLRAVYRQGVVINVLNPKVALFFLSFLPQFADPAAGHVAAQIILLGVLFNTTGLLVNAAVAVGIGSTGRWLARRGSLRRAQRWVTGTLLIALGIGLAVANRR